VNRNQDEHFDLFKKAKMTQTTTSLGSENSGLYRKFVPIRRDINWLVQYFIFEEKKRRGFTSVYLPRNPYENHFYEYIKMCEERDKGLPESVAHGRLLADLERFHKQALASLEK